MFVIYPRTSKISSEIREAQKDKAELAGMNELLNIGSVARGSILPNFVLQFPCVLGQDKFCQQQFYIYVNNQQSNNKNILSPFVLFFSILLLWRHWPSKPVISTPNNIYLRLKYLFSSCNLAFLCFSSLQNIFLVLFLANYVCFIFLP